MPGPFRILGYAIVSSDGMIADSTGLMPNALIFDADKKFFERELARADAVVQGRNSYEYQADSPNRRRLVLTRQIASLAPDPNFPRGFLWNPAGASFSEACLKLGLEKGTIAILGGPYVYKLFLDLGCDGFYLCRAAKVALPGGVTVFPGVGPGRTPEDVLKEYGFEPGPVQTLDEANALTFVVWTRRSA
ncbi:MAG TPA: dihydrofolate reductase [Roseiarcus sp.]|nr:dihydrofolate reductase [Roseiarcus sp.]